MAQISNELKSTLEKIQQNLLSIVDDAKAAEFHLLERDGETNQTIVVLDELTAIAGQAADLYVQISRLLLRTAEIKPYTERGRSKLPEQKKEKRKNFPLRLSPSERIALEEKAEQAGLKLSPYLRQAGLNKNISNKTKRVPEINRATYVELGRIGNNINQMTKAAHQSLRRGTGCNFDPIELNGLLELLKQIRLEVLAVEQQSQDDSQTD